MKAIRVYRFGGPEVMLCEEIVRPTPASNEVLVRIEAAGVGPWDAWIRAGHSALPQPLPLTLGSDVAGVVEDVGTAVSGLHSGAKVYGVTNAQFTGGYAEYAVCEAGMLAEKPSMLSFIEAASLPVIASTAWQMLFDHAKIQPGQRVLILGASGSVGSIAVQLAHRHRVYTIAAISSEDEGRMTHLGADQVIDMRTARIADLLPVDTIIDVAGGNLQAMAIGRLRRGGYIVSAVLPPEPRLLEQHGATGTFFLVKATTRGLQELADLFDRGALSARVGTVLNLDQAQLAHRMLDGIEPYVRGKIVLAVSWNSL